MARRKEIDRQRGGHCEGAADLCGLLVGDAGLWVSCYRGIGRPAFSDRSRRSEELIRRQMIGGPGVRVLSCYEVGRDTF